jgi:hypothetical protein
MVSTFEDQSIAENQDASSLLTTNLLPLFFFYSEGFNKVVIARSEASCLSAKALRRASVAIS